MTSLLGILARNNFFRHARLKNIFFASLLVALAFPAYTLYFVFPSFNRLLIRIYSDHAVRSASHLASMLLPGAGDINRASISARISGESSKVMENLGLIKYKVFSSGGEIVFSTAAEDIGTINRHDYFQNIVSKGKVFALMVKRDQRTLEGQTFRADVIETYVPIMRGNRFRGAFEIYFDVTDAKQMVDRLLAHSSAVIVLLALGLWGIVVAVLIKENRDIIARKRAEEERLRFEKLQGALETAGGICHELNQPIQAVSGFAELLLSELPEEHPYSEKIRSIYEQITRMGAITRKLMTITRYETKVYVDGEKIIDIEKSSSP